MHCAIGARRYKKNFCFHASENSFFFFHTLNLLDDRLLCLFYVRTYLLDVIFQISDFSSAKADFGTDLAISTRMELNPGNYYELSFSQF